MSRIYEAMTEWFREDDWKFQEAEKNGFIIMSFQGKNALWQIFAQARDDQDQFVMYAVAPVKANEEKRAAVAEFLTRANYGLILGNFELDFSDGEIRYKTSIDMNSVFEIKPLFNPCVYANVLTADRYFPGLTAVLYAGQSPEAAVADVEKGTEEPEES